MSNYPFPLMQSRDFVCNWRQSKWPSILYAQKGMAAYVAANNLRTNTASTTSSAGLE